MTDFNLVRVLATREGGAVRRCHAIPHNSTYNIAQHSFGAVSLLLLLHPNPSLALIKAVQWHDVAERWLGDMPSPGKGHDAELAEHYERVEAGLLDRLGLAQDLRVDEREWLKAVDTLELWLWCREEEALGNRNVARMRNACEVALGRLNVEKRLPVEVVMFYLTAQRKPHMRLSDYFVEVEQTIDEGDTADGPRQVERRLAS